MKNSHINWKKSFLFCFYFVFILFLFFILFCFQSLSLYLLISGLGAAGVVVVEAEVFFHVVPGWWACIGCRSRGRGRGLPSRICKHVVENLRRTVEFVATATANAILVSFCWCRCKRWGCKCVGWNRCWRCAVGFKTCFNTNRFLLDILFLCVRKNNPIRRVWIHDARFALGLNPFTKVLWNDAWNPEENVDNGKTEVCIRMLEFHKINTRNNRNALALKNALHICLVHLIAVDSGNVESSKRVRSGCQLWLSGHIETCGLVWWVKLMNVKQVKKFSIYIFVNEKYKIY